MLVARQIIGVGHYIDSLPDNDKNKELLNMMFDEYRKYIQYGTPEDFAQCREWQDMSITDIRKNFNNVVKGLRNEMDDARRLFRKREKELEDQLKAKKKRSSRKKILRRNKLWKHYHLSCPVNGSQIMCENCFGIVIDPTRM